MIEITPSYAYFRECRQPYYQKKFVQVVIKRSDLWVRKWSKVLMEELELEDFIAYYKPRSGLNFHQACVLAIISDWRHEYPSISDEQLKEIIIENLDELSIESIIEDCSLDSPEDEPQSTSQPRNVTIIHQLNAQIA